MILVTDIWMAFSFLLKVESWKLRLLPTAPVMKSRASVQSTNSFVQFSFISFVLHPCIYSCHTNS